MAKIKALRPDEFPGGGNDGCNPVTVLVQEAGPPDVEAAGADERAARWQRKNAEAIACYNHYIANNGLPLDEFRIF
ncbi:type II toxin-antitoxin system CcdA family antitoxin [Paraburkholderia sp. SIMBA_055]|nr:hypothetical protein EN871_32675 [bacterium M00.F.Ca.ET.228.01.1.1]TGR95182.1 hypothetical protein EN834_32635 [bacterium M00.F.Ca.ET.191.01.1.1]TGT95961.1 hypothetical protein EN798_32645 [bacterium M00.F.Ca.ET.155.01.1.1]